MSSWSLFSVSDGRPGSAEGSVELEHASLALENILIWLWNLKVHLCHSEAV